MNEIFRVSALLLFRVLRLLNSSVQVSKNLTMMLRWKQA